MPQRSSWVDHLVGKVRRPADDKTPAAARRAPAAEPASFDPRAPVAADDVIQAYRVFLGREAESEVVVAERVGQTRQEILNGFLGSGEFAGAVASGALGSDPASGLFRNHADDAARLWLIRFFGLDGGDAARARAAHSMAALLGLALRRPAVAAVVDAALGEGRAEALAAAASTLDPDRPAEREAPLGFRRPNVARHAVDAARAAGRPATSSADLQNCYLLLLGRAAESPDVVRAQPGTAVLDAASNFLTSGEFEEGVVARALDGRLAKDEPLSADLRAWAADTFRIALRGQAGRYEALALVLANPVVARAVLDADKPWPLGLVVEALRAHVGLETDGPASVMDHLADVACGFEPLEATAIAFAGAGGAVRFLNGDPWIRLKPDAASARAELMEVQLRAAASRGLAEGKLYVDYGAGYSEQTSITLAPDRHGYQSAVLVAPQGIREVRWDPVASASDGRISVLTARPLRLADWRARRAEPGGEGAAPIAALIAEAAGAPDVPVAFALSKLLSRHPDEQSYPGWLLRNEPQGADARERWAAQLAGLGRRPLISILVPTYNTPEPLLVEMVESVRAQVYPDWQLCIADDASPKPHVREVLRRYAAADDRIRFAVRDENGHISAASNSALELVEGEWVALLDHDDLLTPNALLAVAVQLDATPGAELVYSDEDKIDQFGERFQPYFKPDFAYELLLAQNYLNHLTVHRTANIRAVGGWRRGYEGSQDYDLTLRILERIDPAGIVHIPEILYHWRAIAGSTALSGGEKSYAVTAGMKALEEHLQRLERPARVELLPEVRQYRVRYALAERRPFVSLIIPTRDKASVLAAAVESILDKSTYDQFEVIVVDNGSVEDETHALFRRLQRDRRVRLLPYPHPFNYSRINNVGVRHARGEIIGLVNNDVEVITPDWMEEMVSWAMQPEVGCVGAKLLYPDLTVQHAGVIIGLGGVANHSHRFSPREDPGYFGRLRIHQTVSAVTGACLLVRREVYDAVGGLEEKLAVAFNDVDFCLRVREAGYRNVFTPFAELYHHESISRGVEDNPEKLARFAGEVEYMTARWGDRLGSDPFYSPNLTSRKEDFSLGESPYRRGLAA